MSTTADLVAAGVSIWLDDLSRGDLRSGRLAELIEQRDVSGITSNPTIFANAVANDPDSYAGQLADLRERGMDPAETAVVMMTDDGRAACDVFLRQFEATGGLGGRVSIEVTPAAAHDTEATLAEVHRLVAIVDRPNLLVKIPATGAGVSAIEEATAAGISINVTLIFGLGRYRQVIAAYRDGLIRARTAGHDVSRIRSVASFFVSRVDVETDRRLAELKDAGAADLAGRAAIANARLAYREFERSLEHPDWVELAAAGSNVQRPLWASTGVKDPRMPDTRYVDELIAPDTVSTMPRKTLEAFADHGAVSPDTIRPGYRDAEEVVAGLERVGISLEGVAETLEAAGVAAFEKSWTELLDTLSVS